MKACACIKTKTKRSSHPLTFSGKFHAFWTGAETTLTVVERLVENERQRMLVGTCDCTNIHAVGRYCFLPPSHTHKQIFSVFIGALEVRDDLSNVDKHQSILSVHSPRQYKALHSPHREFTYPFHYSKLNWDYSTRHLNV